MWKFGLSKWWEMLFQFLSHYPYWYLIILNKKRFSINLNNENEYLTNIFFFQPQKSNCKTQKSYFHATEFSINNNQDSSQKAMNNLYCICIKLQRDPEGVLFNAKISNGFRSHRLCCWTTVPMAETLWLLTPNPNSLFYVKRKLTSNSGYSTNCSKFDQENFFLDFYSMDWEDLKTAENWWNVDNSNQIHFDKINILLDTYATPELICTNCNLTLNL